MDPYLNTVLDDTFPAFHPCSSGMLFSSHLNANQPAVYNEATGSKEVASGACPMVSIIVSHVSYMRTGSITPSVILFFSTY